MNESPSIGGGHEPPSRCQRVDQWCDEFDRLFKERLAVKAELPRIEEYLDAAAPTDREHLLRELLPLDFELRRATGLPPKVEDYRQRFAEYRQVVESLVDTAAFAGSGHPHSTIVGHTASGASPPVALGNDKLPQSIGRYQIQKVLGRGGFAVVYLAHDPQLDRKVALKVPRLERFESDEQLKIFVREARNAAGLEHPSIVQVYDVQEQPGLVYIVQQYIAGKDLARIAATSQFSPRQIAKLLIRIAEAVGFAHSKQLIHRDLKLANILVDQEGRAFLADFGLALHASVQARHVSELAGTYPYMSPEQVRRESHRLDGRSDLWSLGIILYELLTKRRPFGGSSQEELFYAIQHVDPEPPSQLNPAVSKELDRICMTCLAKRASDRYQTAGELIDDLRHWLQPTMEAGQSEAAKSSPIVPKGLRSYDASDADFFLELLPGPHDRDGLPKSVRFWKNLIERPIFERTFTVGLMYGPSGCGKSSLVKAGLLPRLSRNVVPVYVEATAADTETRLISALRDGCLELPADATLPELVALLRTSGGSRRRKVLLVIDQFEQWLHANAIDSGSQLVAALRQCDGNGVQCIILVRDDFYSAVNRFFQQIETPLVEDHNAALVDLFDADHARKVLIALGRAYERLPPAPADLSASQLRYVEKAVLGLCREGKVVCIQLTVLADMMKGRTWNENTLREIGGTAGVGEAFLEEKLGAKTASLALREHHEGLRAILRELLPAVGTEIKGQMRSYDALLDAAGYRDRRQDFDGLLRHLDSDVRLITPTEPDGTTARAAVASAGSQSHFYQLTHDFLVPSLRDWLARKQGESRRGRAELRLADRAATWNAKRENRQLPSLWEYLNIRALTDTRHWNDGQRSMMAQATRVHGLRSALGAIALVALFAMGMLLRTNFARQQEFTRIRGLVSELTNAEPAQVPGIAMKLTENPDLAKTFLTPLLSINGSSPDDRRALLHARLASVARDESLVEPLVEELLNGKPTYVIPIRQLLSPRSSKLADHFRRLLRDEMAKPKQRFHAALALADYIPESESASWTDKDLKFVAEQLASSNAEFQPLLREALRPIHAKLLPDLERIFGDAKATDPQRLSAANAFADYSASDVIKLSQLLAVATPEQYAVLYPLLAANFTPGARDELCRIVAELPPHEIGSVDRIAYGKRRANAAVTLLRLGEHERVLPVFDWTDDPEALTQFIFRCGPREVGVDSLLNCLQVVSAAPKNRFPKDTRYALLLALGEFSLEEIPEARRDALLAQLANWYRDDPSSGVHGATGWLLRQWRQTEIVRQSDQAAVPYSPERQWFTLAITVTAAPTPPIRRPKPPQKNSGNEAAKPTDAAQSKPMEDAKVAVAPQSAIDVKSKADTSSQSLSSETFYYTFIVFSAGEYLISSVADEPNRGTDEVRHPVKLTRPFALLDREITMAELIAFSPLHANFMQQFNDRLENAGSRVSWYDAVGFCRWLGAQAGLPESDQAYAAPDSLDKEQYPREPDRFENWAPQNWPVDVTRRGFRLPTEAEWEIASRAGARSAYCYGSDVDLLGRFGWYVENSDKKVHPPRQLCPTIRGIFDLHGNLSEWTHDWLQISLRQRTLVVDPVGPLKPALGRSVRGGELKLRAEHCRSAFRFGISPTYRGGNVGFRLVLSLPRIASDADQDMKR